MGIKLSHIALDLLFVLPLLFSTFRVVPQAARFLFLEMLGACQGHLTDAMRSYP